jgi:hypothetical protein
MKGSNDVMIEELKRRSNADQNDVLFQETANSTTSQAHACSAVRCLSCTNAYARSDPVAGRKRHYLPSSNDLHTHSRPLHQPLQPSHLINPCQVITSASPNFLNFSNLKHLTQTSRHVSPPQEISPNWDQLHQQHARSTRLSL